MTTQEETESCNLYIENKQAEHSITLRFLASALYL